MSRRRPTGIWFFCSEKMLPSIKQSTCYYYMMEKTFKQRIHNFCYFSLFYTWIIGENISLVSSVFDAVRHLTTLRETDHLRLLKASPNMYTNLQSNVIQHFKQEYFRIALKSIMFLSHHSILK